MAAIDFPDSPTLNQIFTAGNSTYRWSGEAWVSNNQIVPTKDITYTFLLMGA